MLYSGPHWVMETNWYRVEKIWSWRIKPDIKNICYSKNRSTEVASFFADIGIQIHVTRPTISDMVYITDEELALLILLLGEDIKIL